MKLTKLLNNNINFFRVFFECDHLNYYSTTINNYKNLINNNILKNINFNN